MIIDGNPKEKQAMQAFRRGDDAEGNRLQDEYLAELYETIKTGDHCSCTAACKHHGNCLECVVIHRGHRDHLPNCFRDMVNERIAAISELTEHTVLDERKK